MTILMILQIKPYVLGIIIYYGNLVCSHNKFMFMKIINFITHNKNLVPVWTKLTGKGLTWKKSSEIQRASLSGQERNPALDELNTHMRKQSTGFNSSKTWQGPTGNKSSQFFLETEQGLRWWYNIFIASERTLSTAAYCNLYKLRTKYIYLF
jgi:hypothetical protein